MKRLITIGLISVFATCNQKSATIILDNSQSISEDGHPIIERHCYLVSGPAAVTFDSAGISTQDTKRIFVTGTKIGIYVIGTWVKDDRNLSDTCYTYINALPNN